MPKSPLPIREYKCDTDRIIKRYYPERVTYIKEDYAVNRPKRSRHNNISSFMMSIISMIHFLEEDAKQMGMVIGMNFFGIAGSDLAEWFKNYANKETVYDNLYRLSRIRMLIRVEINKEFYYQVNDKDFICKNGVYLFKYGDVGSFGFLDNLFIGYCDICHYCNYKPVRCNFKDIFIKKMQTISSTSRDKVTKSEIYKDLETRISKNKTNYLNRKKYRKILKNHDIDPKKLTEEEVDYYYKIIEKEDDDEKIEEIIENTKRLMRKKKTKQKDISDRGSGYLKVVKKIDDTNKTMIIVDEWGFNPLMMSIMNVINLGREDSQMLNIEFPGFSMYHIEQMLDGLWISNETIYDNLYKLQRMNLIKKIFYDDDEKPRNMKNEFYFDLNEDRFLCIGGIYLFYYPHALNKYKIFNGVCPHHHFCVEPRCSSNCKLISSIENVASLISDKKDLRLVNYLKDRFKEWSQDFDYYELYKDNLESIIMTNINYINSEILRRSKEKRVEKIKEMTTEDLLSSLTNIEILYYGKSLTMNYEDDREFRKLIDGLCETIALFITRKIKKERKNDPKYKEEKKKIKVKMNYKDLLHNILSTPFDRKIDLN